MPPSRYFVPAVTALGLLLRLLWILVVDWIPVSDGAWFYERAVSLAAGEGYVLENGDPTALFPPGYPALLGLIFWVTGPSVFAGQCLNLLASLILLHFAYRLAGHWFRSETTARLCLLILAFYPNHIVYHTLLLTELVFTALLLAGLWYLGRPGRRDLLAAALLFAAACYVKPQVALLPAFLLLLSGRPFSGHTWRRMALVYGLMALLAFPWVLRNHQVMGEWTFTTNGGYNLFIGNNPLATGTYGFEGGAENLLPPAEGEGERDRLARRATLRYLADHPWQALARVPAKWYYLFWMGNEGVYWHKMGGKDLGRAFSMGVELAYRLLVGAFVLHLLLSLWPVYRRRCRYPLPPILAMIYFLGIYAIFFGYSRYHFPMIPFIVMFVADGLGAFTCSDRDAGVA